MNGRAQGEAMTHSPYLLFHQTPETVRRIGARGGKAQARNRRERLGRSPIVLIPSTPPLLPRQETSAEAIAELDIVGVFSDYTSLQSQVWAVGATCGSFPGSSSSSLRAAASRSPLELLPTSTACKQPDAPMWC